MSDHDFFTLIGLQVSISRSFIEAYRQHLEQRQVRRPRRRRPRWHVRPHNTPMMRMNHGHYTNLLQTLRLEDEEQFYNFTRMTPRLFDEVLHRVTPLIGKQDTTFRKALEPGLKLALTLRFMAAGDNYRSLSFSFRCGASSISNFLGDVCDAITETYKDEVMNPPQSVEEWRAIAQQFERRWNLPHCCGAIDGKHIAIKQPAKSGAEYRNYKNFYSLVLFALVDADYKFVWIDLGGNGHHSDAQIFNNGDLGEKLREGTLGLPPNEPLPHDDADFPYFLVGDDAFGLKPNLMKPYGTRDNSRACRICNYRISRARRVVENAFGILTTRYQCFLGTLQLQPSNVEKLTRAAVCLHNLHRIRNPTADNYVVDREGEDHELVDGAWREEMRHMLTIDRLPKGNYDLPTAKVIRDYLCAYVNSRAGRVPWQENMIEGGRLY